MDARRIPASRRMIGKDPTWSPTCREELRIRVGLVLGEEQGRAVHDFHANPRRAGVDESQPFRGRPGNVKQAPSYVWPTVVDPQHYVLIVLEVGDADSSSNGSMLGKEEGWSAYDLHTDPCRARADKAQEFRGSL